MKAVKFLGKFFAIIFLIAFSILVLLMMLIGMAKSMITEENISKYIVSSNIFTSTSGEILGDNNNTLKQAISNKFLEMEISERVTESVLSSNEFNDVLTSYVYSYINNLLFSSEREKLDNNKIVSIVQDKYYEVEGVNLNDAQLVMLNDYVSDLCLKVYDFTPALNELEGLGINVDVLKFVSSICYFKYIWFCLGAFVLLLYILIAICFWSKLKAFKWCSNILIIDGVILVITSFLEVKFFSMFVNSKGIIDSLVLTIANKSFENLLFYGIALMILGIILLIICAVILKKERKEDSDALLNSVIEEEVSAKKTLEDHRIKNSDELEKTLNNLEKIEIEKVLLDKISDKKITDKVVTLKDEEIPKIVIEGEDFEKSDVDDVKPNEDIFVSNESVLAEETNEKINSDLSEVSDVTEFVEPLEKEKEETKEEEEVKEFEIIDSGEDDIEKEVITFDEKIDYEEISDEKEEKVIKKDVKVFPIEEIKLDITSPKKGKNIEFKDTILKDSLKTDEDEEEIEIL